MQSWSWCSGVALFLKNRNAHGCEGFSGRALQTEAGGGPLPLGLLAIGSRKAALPSPGVF